MSSLANSVQTALGTQGTGALVGGLIGGVPGAAIGAVASGGGIQTPQIGSSYQAQQSPIQTPTTTGQATDANTASQAALAQQQAFVQALQAQNGAGNQSQVFNQLQGVANGTGPNPAQAQLAQATGANVANQAAMAAGQRGAGANVGLLERQNAMQGANTQQQAVGQAATLQANQSLNAINSMGTIANQQVTNQSNATNAATTANQNQQQNLLNSIGQQNNAQVGMQSNINSTNASTAAANAQQNGNLIGNVLGAGGAALALLADGGAVSSAPTTTSGPQSKVGQHFATGGKTALPKFAEGGKVPAMVSPGEVYLKPEAVQKVAQGADPIKAGEKIPGKAKVKGNSYANDTVSKTLDEGGIVLPKSVMESKNPHWAAHRFVQEVMAKQGAKLPKKG